ncbi:GNAT family N-acetyltransferase [Vibrio europaeus]|uniref:GNAT family N-acetyltransferase n=1 Tax=Vibrio europaeus TaxID=300876 RepID=UPI00233EB602|nr:GNAT family N-acetyltransferase [Vibrio europaeus]MDC5853289.1 GNAT family N-acetyltransferase [Vibrio europaeus]
MHTDRLIIRSWLPSDRAPLAQLNQHPKMVGCCPDQQSRDASDRFAAQCESLIEARGWGLWALELRATRAFVGFAGLQLELSPLGEEQALVFDPSSAKREGEPVCKEPSLQHFPI